MDTVAAAAHLERARAGIRHALANWDPSNLERIASSRDLLVAAVSEMRAFENAVRLGEVLSTEELCTDVLQAKQDIVRATRLVDACVAFHRGLAARTGNATSGYTAEGQLSDDSADVEPEVHA